MSFIGTGQLMVFDIYVPSLNIIIEYHGYQHYYDHYLFGDVKSLQERDKEKRIACTNHNISYLEVPYWWQHDKESVISSINQIRPDLIPDVSVVIPFHYPVITKPIKPGVPLTTVTS